MHLTHRTGRLLTVLVFALLAIETNAQRRAGGSPRTPERVPVRVEAETAPSTEILAIEQIDGGQSPGESPAGKFFRVEASVPKHHLAALEVHSGAPDAIWTPAGEEVFATGGHVEFGTYSETEQALFRVKTRSFPARDILLNGTPHLEITEEVDRRHLALYLGSKLGIKLKPDGSRRGGRILPPPIPLESPVLVSALNTPAALDALFVSAQVPSEGLKKLYKRPELYSFATGQFETSGSVIEGESLKIPMRWNVSREGVKRARYVIQRTPFSDPSKETATLPESTVGWVHNDWYPSADVGVAFWLDFGNSPPMGSRHRSRFSSGSTNSTPTARL